MIVAFDLDDTLYEEITFVKSGLLKVAEFISVNFNISQEKIYESLLKNLQISREKVFDRTFIEYNIKPTKKLIRKTLSVYRKHFPNIELFEEAKECMKRLNGLPIYIVTDGNIITQKNKLVALNLYNNKIIKKCFITHRYGIKNAKPSPYCFIKIAKMENAPYEKIVYVGDNPLKDFRGIKPLGFKTIRVLTGAYKSMQVPEEWDAHITIPDLSHLTLSLLGALLK